MWDGKTDVTSCNECNCENYYAPNISNLALTNEFRFSINVPINYEVFSDYGWGSVSNIIQLIVAQALNINWTNVMVWMFDSSASGNTDLSICIYTNNPVQIKREIESQVIPGTTLTTIPSFIMISRILTTDQKSYYNSQPFDQYSVLQERYNYFVGPGTIYYITK
jgi:hypothetical protein